MFIAYAFEWAGVTPKVIIIMLLVASFIISVSIWRHRFFDKCPTAVAVIANSIVSLIIAVSIGWGWIIFQPNFALPPIMQ